MAGKMSTVKKIILGTVGTLVLFILVLIINLLIFEKRSSVVSKGQPIENYGEHKKALLVLDIQEATTGEVSMNAFYKTNAEELINKINQIADQFKKENAPIIYVRTEITNPLVNLLNNSYAKGSPGSKFDKRLKLNSDLEIVKGGNDTFRNTELDKILAANKISELYVVGLDAAYCINITSEAAQNRNYQVNMIKEAILSESEAMKDSMMADFNDRGIHILTINDITTRE